MFDRFGVLGPAHTWERDGLKVEVQPGLGVSTGGLGEGVGSTASAPCGSESTESGSAPPFPPALDEGMLMALGDALGAALAAPGPAETGRERRCEGGGARLGAELDVQPLEDGSSSEVSGEERDLDDDERTLTQSRSGEAPAHKFKEVRSIDMQPSTAQPSGSYVTNA